MSTTQSYTLITGATSGIGYELAKLFAADGNNLVIVARHIEDLQRVADELKAAYNIDVIVSARDLFLPSAPFELHMELREKGIVVDTLVNDAGQGQFGEFSEADIHRLLDIIQLNISSLVVLTKLYLNDMLERGSGKILNLSSIASRYPGPFHAVYHATKAFVQSFTEAIRDENKDKGVIITALLPGTTATDFFNKANMNDSKAVQEGKMADPATVAKDGYEALEAGDDMVISGFKNKFNLAMGKLMSDETKAAQMHKMQEPADTENH
ncbi:SDR family NAD(P)-dependent oxidoreductase [Sediminibacterium ginsengisoli]|uniref:Short-chain dehydrogenase n=1 Tax=Sediminibacterium ginsengisoli TaxID=413434 RepID=A0A1T4P888_9BACT|nr:SDR family oxidoreductase [Sediminibacterium ginsengisoli]SJZ87537.1 hypothetical protein SAMN04488132_105198 [Sediminibacterium ginsengisoli]